MIKEALSIWKNWDRDERIEYIEGAIEDCNVNEGFLEAWYTRRNRDLCFCITKKLENHLCTVAVSQETLSELFSADHAFEEGDAEVILNWMEAQK